MAWQPTDDLAQAVALEVLLHGPLSRSDLARRLSLAPATLTRISTDLIRSGLLVESPHLAERRTGRPSIPLDVMPEAHHFVGVKLAGDRIMAVLTNLRADVLDHREALLESHAPEYVATRIADLATQIGGGLRIAAVGIGLGGVVDGRGSVSSAPFLDWHEVPLASLVRARVSCPVFAANDLAAFTEAQHWFGLGSGHDNFAVITLGVGVGFGSIANGRLLAGPDAGVGLVGHWPLDPFGPRCRRGHRGCADAMLTIPAIEKDLSAALGHPVRWDEALGLVHSDDPAARQIFTASGRALGRLIAAVANLTAPELVIIGGEGVALAASTEEAILDGVLENRDPRADPVRIELASGENTSWCQGAAVVAIQGYVHGRLDADT
ncbi:ROK family transcriptional regulator [Microbacterium karelineae]|uniref:ROK family transcriptional regulator n=1 Tax=Microbacterium karelineae TaxID=2654283 RepID=UPI0012E9D0D9|nr:ROK family transcriptional regulator [Microbacterium karelineae]